MLYIINCKHSMHNFFNIEARYKFTSTAALNWHQWHTHNLALIAFRMNKLQKLYMQIGIFACMNFNGFRFDVWFSKRFSERICYLLGMNSGAFRFSVEKIIIFKQ